jgi:hypothetical protein
MKNKIPAFSITIANDNVASGSAFYLLFDADGINESIGGIVYGNAKKNFDEHATSSVSPSVIAETTKTKPIKITGFNYQVQNSSDFSNNFDFLVGNIDGRQIRLPNVIQKARRNTQFDSTLLTIDEEIIIDSKTALFMSVTNGTTVTLTFFVEELI